MRDTKLRYNISLSGRRMANTVVEASDMRGHYKKVKEDNPTYQLTFDEHCILFMSQSVVAELLERA